MLRVRDVLWNHIIFLSRQRVWQAHQAANKHHNKHKQTDMFWRRCYSGNNETQPSGAFVSDMLMVWNSGYLCCFFNTVGMLKTMRQTWVVSYRGKWCSGKVWEKSTTEIMQGEFLCLKYGCIRGKCIKVVILFVLWFKLDIWLGDMLSWMVSVLWMPHAC